MKILARQIIVTQEVPPDVTIPEVSLDYSPEVAKEILLKLSIDFNELECWNVPEAPTLEQLVTFWNLHCSEFDFTTSQIQNVEKHLQVC